MRERVLFTITTHTLFRVLLFQEGEKSDKDEGEIDEVSDVI